MEGKKIAAWVAGFAIFTFLIAEGRWVRADGGEVCAKPIAVSSERSGRFLPEMIAPGFVVKKGEVLGHLDLSEVKREIELLESDIAQMGDLERGLERAIDKYVNARSEMDLGLRDGETMEEPLMELERAQGAIEKRRIAEARLQELKTWEKNGTVKAPCDGVVMEWLKGAGDELVKGEGVCRLADLSQAWVLGHFQEREVKRLKVGARAEVTLDGRSCKGRIVAIGGAVVSHKVPVKIVLDESIEMRPGAEAQIRVRL
jgi:multidrug resistance efflux pump